MAEITLLEKKEATCQELIRRLLRSDVADRVLKVALFGSTVRGTVRPDSDVDLLIVAGGDVAHVQNACSDLSFDLMLEQEEHVSPMVYCLDDYRSPGYFLSEVKASGREVYSVSDEKARRREAEDLADAREGIELAQRLVALLPHALDSEAL